MDPNALFSGSCRYPSFTIADMKTRIDAARLLVWRAAWMGRNGVPMTGGQGSMSKLKAGDVTMWATTTLMDLVGPYAQSTECPLEKWFRDAKIYQIFEGTAQVQRLVVSRMQRQAYQDKMKEAAEVLQQAPGTPADVLCALVLAASCRVGACAVPCASAPAMPQLNTGSIKIPTKRVAFSPPAGKRDDLRGNLLL